MARTIQALVTPKVLIWARKLDRIEIDEVAAKMNVSTDKIEAWENGSLKPTLRQAKNLAKYYRVPFVYFYLPDEPKKTKRLDKVDYRTFGNTGSVDTMSRELRWLLRDVEDRRDTMLELYKIEETPVKPFAKHIDKDTNNMVFANMIRQLLEITPASQKHFRKPENFLSYCIAKLEEMDCLVFQAAKIDPSEMRGLSISYDTFPIIVLNRKDEPSARLFTLIHELVHIITRTSGICNDISYDASSSNNIELKCNEIAGLVLVQKNEIMSHSDIAKIQTYGLDDTYIRNIARDFAVSKEVILHHLWDMKIISKQLYFDTLKKYTDEYLQYKSKKKGGFLPPALDKGTQVGKLYARTVMNSFHGEKITARDASNYLLNLGTKHFENVERWCFR